MALMVRALRENEYPAWNAVVAASPEGTIYHDTRWLDPVCKAAGDVFSVYGFFLGGRLVAGLPLQIRRKGPFTLARRAFATPYAHPVISPDCAREVAPLLPGAVAEVGRKHSQTVLTGSPFASGFGLGPKWRIARRATYLLDISDPDNVWRGFVYQLRKKIRKAIRLNIKVKAGCTPEAFYQLYRRTFERRGLDIRVSFNRLADLLNSLALAHVGKTYAATTEDGETCAVGLVLFDARRAYHALAGTDVDATKAPASALLLWEIIQDLSSSHCQFDLVGANIPGIIRFKKQFGGRLVGYDEATNYRSNIERMLICTYQYLRKRREAALELEGA